MEIIITDLTKQYRENVVLNHVSLTIGNGMYGLLGRNGAGKTTLMRILSTLLKPSGGRITFDGVPLEETKQIRSLIGYLPQEFSLYPDMSVWETMRYLAAMSDIPAGIQKERIPDLLEGVHLWEIRKRKVRKLSGGMKRRLGIAQALLNDPQVLIVDEPTVGLDPEERLRFYNLLGELSGSRVVIVSSHIVADMESVCEYAAILDSGRLLYAGAIDRLAGTAEGKVFELTVPRTELESVKRKFCVLSSQGHSSGLKVRVLSDCVPDTGHPVSCTPTVEDGYMQLLRQM